MIEAFAALSGVGPSGAAAVSGPAAARTVAIAPGVQDAPDFGAVLAQMGGGGLQTMRAAEATAISGMQGAASVQQVVQAVMGAEQALQTALAVRDKVVAAYQEISRMAI